MATSIEWVLPEVIKFLTLPSWIPVASVTPEQWCAFSQTRNILTRLNIRSHGLSMYCEPRRYCAPGLRFRSRMKPVASWKPGAMRMVCRTTCRGQRQVGIPCPPNRLLALFLARVKRWIGPFNGCPRVVN